MSSRCSLRPPSAPELGARVVLLCLSVVSSACLGTSTRVLDDGPSSSVPPDSSSPETEPSASRAWDPPWQRHTPHWTFETDHSSELADRVAIALEDAYQAFAAHFGRRPLGTSAMRVLGFKAFPDYRAYCERVGAPGQLAATGFAPSEAGTCVCWDKHDDADHFLGTLIHEACHLYYVESTRRSAPSWLAEGMATYFEGFDADAHGHLRFHHRPRARLATLRKLLARGTAMSLHDLVHLEANALINRDPQRALAFYAASWGYYYFFHTHPNLAWRQGFARYVAETERGVAPDLERHLGTRLETIDAELARFIARP